MRSANVLRLGHVRLRWLCGPGGPGPVGPGARHSGLARKRALRTVLVSVDARVVCGDAVIAQPPGGATDRLATNRRCRAMLTAWRTHRERAGFDAHVSLRNLTRTRRVTPVPIHQIPVVARVARLLDAATATHHTRTALAAQRLRAALGHAGRRAARTARASVVAVAGTKAGFARLVEAPAASAEPARGARRRGFIRAAEGAGDDGSLCLTDEARSRDDPGLPDVA